MIEVKKIHINCVKKLVNFTKTWSVAEITTPTFQHYVIQVVRA